MTSLKEKLIKIGAKVEGHGRFVAFQMAEAAISRLVPRHPAADRGTASTARSNASVKYSIVLSRPTDGRGASR
jgi:hypothetical protein